MGRVKRRGGPGRQGAESLRGPWWFLPLSLASRPSMVVEVEDRIRCRAPMGATSSMAEFLVAARDSGVAFDRSLIR